MCISAEAFWTVLPSQSFPLALQCPEVPDPEEPLRKRRNDAGQGTSKGRRKDRCREVQRCKDVGKGAVSLPLLLTEACISPWPQLTACVRVERSLQIKTYSGGPALVLTSPLLPVVSEGTGGIPGSCGVRLVNFRKERVLRSLPAGTHGSLHPKECGLRTERKELPSPRPAPRHHHSLAQSSDQRCPFPSFASGLELRASVLLPNYNTDPQKSRRVSSAAKYHPGKELHRKTAWE